MTTELLSLDDLPANLISVARMLVAVPNANGLPLKYKAPLNLGTTTAPGSLNALPDGGFVFAQPIPALTWTITHNLNRYPQVTVVDTTGRQLDADVTYVSANQVVVSGLVTFAGTAYLI